jgi:hypothetical protein
MLIEPELNNKFLTMNYELPAAYQLQTLHGINSNAMGIQ